MSIKGDVERHRRQEKKREKALETRKEALKGIGDAV